MKTTAQWAERLRRDLSGRSGFDRVGDDEVWSCMAADMERMFFDCQQEALQEGYDRAAEAMRPG